MTTECAQRRELHLIGPPSAPQLLNVRPAASRHRQCRDQPDRLRLDAVHSVLVFRIPSHLAGGMELEELRVSLFAQAVGTAHPVSEKRIYKAMDQVEGQA